MKFSSLAHTFTRLQFWILLGTKNMSKYYSLQLNFSSPTKRKKTETFSRIFLLFYCLMILSTILILRKSIVFESRIFLIIFKLKLRKLDAGWRLASADDKNSAAGRVDAEGNENFLSVWKVFCEFSFFIFLMSNWKKIIKYIRSFKRENSLWTTTLNQRDWIDYRTNVRSNKGIDTNSSPFSPTRRNTAYTVVKYPIFLHRAEFVLFYVHDVHTYHKFFADTSHPSRPTIHHAKKQSTF